MLSLSLWLNLTSELCLLVVNSLHEPMVDLCSFPSILRWNQPGSCPCVGLSLYSPSPDLIVEIHKSLASQGKDTLSSLVWAHWWCDGRGLVLILLCFLARTGTETCLLVHSWFPSNILALPVKFQALSRSLIATWISYILINSKQHNISFLWVCWASWGHPSTEQSDLFQGKYDPEANVCLLCSWWIVEIQKTRNTSSLTQSYFLPFFATKQVKIHLKTLEGWSE